MITKSELVKAVEAHLARITLHLDGEKENVSRRLKNISPACRQKTREKLRQQYVAQLADIDARKELLTFDFLYERAAALHPELKDA